ncbi:MAG: ATPase, T2SS/T4P/T4SS family [Planctomycetota bacterium]|jgi:type II secretory ATPase GspE/PulE/Tfp pilus assembly ATPase PilB-like protein
MAEDFLDLVSDLKGQLEEKIILEEINKTICSTFQLDEVIEQIIDQTCRLLNCDRCTVYVIERSADGSSRELVSRSLIGDEVNEIRVPYDHNSIAGYVACTGQVIRLVDVYDDDELLKISPNPKFDKTWDEKTGYRTQSMLVVPAKKDDYVVGIIQVLNKKDGTFDDKDQGHLTDIATSLGEAMETSRSSTQILKKDRVRLTMNDLLIEKELITQAKLDEAIARSKEERIKLMTLLTQHYDVPEVEITKCLAELSGVEFTAFNPDEMLDPDLFSNIPEAYAKRHFVCPIKLTMDSNGKNFLHLVMNNPKDFVAIEDIEIRTGAKIKTITMATRSDIIAMINHCLHPGEAEDDGDLQAMGDLMDEVTEELGLAAPEEVESVNVDEGSTEEDGPIVRLCNRIIEEAFRKGASDIHVEPMENYVLVRYRVDGALEKSLNLPGHARSAIVSRYKIMSECNITEHRIPQDGRIRFKECGGRYDIELRVNICPTVGGNEDVVMRILADSKPLPLEKLGLYPYTFDPLQESVNKPYGMILCVGPTGSGKTTTLHSAVSYINNPDKKILTAENPVEITQEGLRQVQIKPETGMTFKAALRAFLRQDPDVILVGEMRDLETCEIAVEAALTGHLLLSTLHTNNAPETVTRLVDIGIDPVTLSDALLVVLAQRLARTLCGKCKEQYDPDDEELAIAGYERRNGVIYYLDKEYPEAEFYKPVGCSECQGRAYKGRMGLHELLHNTDETKAMIASGAKVAQIREVAKKNGMMELYEDGMIKVMTGKTSIHQVRAVCIE